MGRGVSHKVPVIRRYVQDLSFSRISHQLGRHGVPSMSRYLRHFSLVMILEDRGLTASQMQGVIGISENLVQQYRQLYAELNVPHHARTLGRLKRAPLHSSSSSGVSLQMPAFAQEEAEKGASMRHRHSDRQETFSPLQDKTIHHVLCQLFVAEFGYDNKVLFAEAMIDRILDTIQAFTRPASLLQPGQMLWMAVAHDGRKHAYQRMKDTPQVPVILDLVTADELQALSNGQDFPSVRRRRHARLLDQALAQNGVLAQGDLAAITLTSQRQVSTDIARVQQTEDRLLPYRSSVQDLGSTFSHRA